MRLRIVDSLWHVSGFRKPDKHWRRFLSDDANSSEHLHAKTSGGADSYGVPDVVVRLRMGRLDTELPGMHQMGEADWITLPDGGILVRYRAGANTLTRWRVRSATYKKPRFTASLRGNASWSAFEVCYLPWRIRGRDIFGIVSEFIFSNRSVDMDGLMLHASAVLTRHVGIVFTGPSETGKTTQARLWELHRGARILNGDRPLLKWRAADSPTGSVDVCGLPWSGSEVSSLNEQAPLRAIFILEQAAENQVVRITSIDALPLLLPRMFLPYYRSDRMEEALLLAGRISTAVPVFRLLCRQDAGAVEAVEACLKELDNEKSSRPDGDSRWM